MKRMIAISGIDGCGKSTVIAALKAELESRGETVSVIWMRFNHYLVKPLFLFCRLVGLTRYEASHPTVGYHEFYRSRLVALCFTVLTWLDTWLATWIFLRLKLRCGDVVICDRYIPDILVDTATDTGYDLSGERGIMPAFFRIAPTDTMYFMLKRDTAAVTACRPEHDIDKHYPLRMQHFATLEAAGVFTCIDNNGSVAEAVEQILAYWEAE
jgi:thymidylate kinase